MRADVAAATAASVVVLGASVVVVGLSAVGEGWVVVVDDGDSGAAVVPVETVFAGGCVGELDDAADAVVADPALPDEQADHSSSTTAAAGQGRPLVLVMVHPDWVAFSLYGPAGVRRRLPAPSRRRSRRATKGEEALSR